MTLIFAVFTFLIAPFLLPGLINKSKALWAGRHGAPIWQPGYDFLKLLRKGQVISKTTSFVFRLAPSVNLAAVVLAALIIPVPQQTALLNFPGDFVLFAYALGLARFLLVAAAMDTGSSFEGMGAAREMTFASIVEPAFFMLIGTLALMTRQSSLSAIVANLDDGAGFAMLVKSLGTIVLFIMLLVEGSRGPVDDPNTHLELTMIHEVMILDYSGPDLAFMQYAASLKMVVITTLLANLLIPASIGPAGAALLFLALFMLVAVGIAGTESLIARLRMSHVPQFIFLMSALALTAFAVVMFFRNGGLR
ncbi:MAG TPA: NADH-quinone oxidoreductase subunit H [bacterium]|nr:NADH-quinone oxidoreductase subunit H [bacterium]